MFTIKACKAVHAIFTQNGEKSMQNSGKLDKYFDQYGTHRQWRRPNGEGANLDIVELAVCRGAAS